MKDILLLLALLVAGLTEVSSSEEACQKDPESYWVEEAERCCRKCRPGHRLVKECTGTTDTECKPCGPNQYMANLNFHPNCFSCTTCKESKGQQYVQTCSPTTNSKCSCMSGWYCNIGFNDPYCNGCEKYKSCRVGFGVDKQGTSSSDVKCKRCTNGTFSDSMSTTQRCQPHTNCGGTAVLRKGNATVDTVCESGPSVPPKEPPASTKTPSTTAGSTTESMHLHTLLVKNLESDPMLNISKTTTSMGPGSQMATTICVVMVVIFLIAMCLLYLCTAHRKGARKLPQKVDGNGNFESGDEDMPIKEAQLTSFPVISQEQQCLLEKGEASSDYSQCSNITETLTRTDGSSSHESIGPLQSAVDHNCPSSALSEPMPLVSNGDIAISQPSSLTQSSSQPTSPQMVNPVTTSPHVNVNITFHIGNGTCGTPSVMSTELKQPDCKLPFGEVEESFSIPQQEDGKQSLMSVQESTDFCV